MSTVEKIWNLFGTPVRDHLVGPCLGIVGSPDFSRPRPRLQLRPDPPGRHHHRQRRRSGCRSHYRRGRQGPRSASDRVPCRLGSPWPPGRLSPQCRGRPALSSHGGVLGRREQGHWRCDRPCSPAGTAPPHLLPTSFRHRRPRRPDGRTPCARIHSRLSFLAHRPAPILGCRVDRLDRTVHAAWPARGGEPGPAGGRRRPPPRGTRSVRARGITGGACLRFRTRNLSPLSWCIWPSVPSSALKR
jgi:hypothetical protein